jgi:multiple sugar transport system permease protein
MLLPFYWMLVTSFKESTEAMAYPPAWWPREFLWKNYVEAWQKPEVGFARYYWITVSTSVAITLGTLITGVLAAFAFARMQFLGKGLFFYLVLATLMVPGQVLIIPNYIILKELNWLNTYSALIVPWMASVFSIFLMRQHFLTIPADLWDAAQIDGAGRLRFLWHVVLPLSKPVMISSSIFNFVAQWNSLLWPLVVTSRPEMRTLMVGLQVFSDSAGGEFHLLMAASTFSILPLVIMFFFLQRFFIEGIARSGLK